MKQFYVGTTKYPVGHLPLDNKLLRDVSFLHPVLRIASMEHKLYVDWQLWCQHYQTKKLLWSQMSGNLKCTRLGKSTRRVPQEELTITGQMTVPGEISAERMQVFRCSEACERPSLFSSWQCGCRTKSFCKQEGSLTPDRTSLGKLTINCLITYCWEWCQGVWRATKCQDHKRVASSLERCTQGTCKKACWWRGRAGKKMDSGRIRERDAEGSWETERKSREVGKRKTNFVWQRERIDKGWKTEKQWASHC